MYYFCVMKTKKVDHLNYEKSAASFSFRPYCKRFKAIQLRIEAKPDSLIEWFWAVYGLDIFINNTPMIKMIFLINLIVWILIVTL